MSFKKYKNTNQHDASDCAAAVISTVLLPYKKKNAHYEDTGSQ
ncbi:hypothetical protein [Erysipelothrix larvae]|nr:hypothetical protein [Erysipelothrix larvae]